MKTIISIYLLMAGYALSAQNLETIAKGDILKGAGGITFNQIFDHAKGKIPSRLPYTYVFTGNVNLQILGFINAPFSFMYSNQGNQSTQPTYNQTSIHPSYKWVSTHFGAIACNYSAFTVNGYVFKGSAIDITPGKLSFSAFYGRFKKAINPQDIIGNMNAIPTYKRMGAGCKLGFKDDKLGNWGIVFFSAKDQINSLPVLILPESNAPKQNWNSSFQMQKSFFKKINFSADLAYSMITEDIRINDKNSALPSLLQFNNTNVSTSIFKAFKSSMSYSIGKGNLNMAYERIDPYYQTFGAYYFNNDLENVTIGFASQFFKQKVIFAANAGFQHDNLIKTKLSTMSRFVGNSNLNIKPNAKINVNFNYSNFLSYTNTRPFTDYQNQLNPYLQWDTLNFRQISQNISGNLLLVLKADSIHTSSLTGSLTYQNAANKQGKVIKNGNAFYNANIGFSYNKIKSGEVALFSLNIGQSILNELELLNFSPVINISKPFLNKKVRPGLSICYTNSYYNKKYSGGVVNLRGVVNYTFQKLHNFSFSFLILNRKDASLTSLYTHRQRFTETTLSIIYSVNMEFFDVKKIVDKRKKI